MEWRKKKSMLASRLARLSSALSKGKGPTPNVYRRFKVKVSSNLETNFLQIVLLFLFVCRSFRVHEIGVSSDL